jgi:hypothetical protein
MRYVLTLLFDADDYAKFEAVEKAQAALASTPGVVLISHTLEESDES